MDSEDHEIYTKPYVFMSILRNLTEINGRLSIENLLKIVNFFSPISFTLWDKFLS